MCNAISATDWERMWAAYDQPTYRLALEALTAQDVVYDIGAGDLRLARQMARVARQVVAVEIDPALIAHSLAVTGPLPGNLLAVCADARTAAIPAGVTVGVLLMRHCTHFSLYAHRLRQAGCLRLVTNARWHMGVEVIDLQLQPISFDAVPIGWYACACGATGFKQGPAEWWTAEKDALTCEVSACPHCKPEIYRELN